MSVRKGKNINLYLDGLKVNALSVGISRDTHCVDIVDGYQVHKPGLAECEIDTPIGTLHFSPRYQKNVGDAMYLFGILPLLFPEQYKELEEWQKEYIKTRENYETNMEYSFYGNDEVFQTPEALGFKSGYEYALERMKKYTVGDTEYTSVGDEIDEELSQDDIDWSTWYPEENSEEW